MQGGTRRKEWREEEREERKRKRSRGGAVCGSDHPLFKVDKKMKESKIEAEMSYKSA